MRCLAGRHSKKSRIPARYAWRSLLAFGALVLGGLPALASIEARTEARTNAKHLNSSFEFMAAQSTDFWNAVSDLDASRGSPVRLERTLRDRYGDHQDAFAKARVRTEVENLYFEATAEASSWAMTENPVVSELHARVLTMGNIAAGYSGRFYDSALRFELGVTGGLGGGKRIDGISTDLLEQVPQKQETARMLGADLLIGLQTPHRHSSSATNSGELGTTFELQSSSYFSNLQARVLTHRWKSLTYVRIHPVGLHFTAGPQPAPVNILPRSWEFVHGFTTQPELRSLLGAGAELVFVRLAHGELKAQGGFYGGYWGAGAVFDARHVLFTAGSWGIGLSPTYQSKAERIVQGSLGIRF